MASSGDSRGGSAPDGESPTAATVPHHGMQEMKTRSNEKLTESSSLSPNANQTYFAEEKIPIPEIEGVIMTTRQIIAIITNDSDRNDHQTRSQKIKNKHSQGVCIFKK